MSNHIKLYKVWPGNSRFLLNGKIFYGPKCDLWPHTISWLLILFIYGMFAINVIPEIWSDNYILCLLTIVLFLLVVTSLILTSTTEPGIIPRKSVF